MPSRAVLFDLSGTLFHIETADHALLAALGPDFVPWAGRLTELGAINGGTESHGLPDHLARVWDERDLSAQAHRAAYSGLSRHAGLTAEQADALYERGVAAEAWHPYPDTIRTLRRLHTDGVPVAVVSNIGWDPRPVLRRYGVDVDLDVLILSDEQGVVKPDPEIFRRACAAVDTAPQQCVMIGDSERSDGGCTALGIRFVLVDADPTTRAPDALWTAAGLSAG